MVHMMNGHSRKNKAIMPLNAHNGKGSTLNNKIRDYSKTVSLLLI